MRLSFRPFRALLAAVVGVAGPSIASADGISPSAVARATAIPACTVYVDAASGGDGRGTVDQPFGTIAAAVDHASPGAVICVAEGVYAETIAPGEKPFTLAGGFKSGSNFEVRDSAAYVSKAQGNGGGSFIRIVDPGPKDGELTAIDGFEITGYGQAILRDHWQSQRFDITNNYIHDNTCAEPSLAGAAFALQNVSGSISGNVIRANACGRGGGGFLNDAVNANTVRIEGNLIDRNAGSEPDASHGGGLYLFGNTLLITGNLFIGNTVTQWGGGLYIGAFRQGNQPTTATLSGNVYRGNKAGDSGGGFFCDNGATCNATNEVYDRNCGGNILLDGGDRESGPTAATFDRITNVRALDVGCDAPGIGVLIDNYEEFGPDSHSFTRSIFWGNAKGKDFATACGSGCDVLTVTLDTSMVDTDYGDGSVRIDFGQGLIAPADPHFVGLDSGDYRLAPDSPAAGLGAEVVETPAEASGAPAEAATTPAAAESADAETTAEPVETVQAAAPARAPAVLRGGDFMGFPEQFNRYYTDPSWTPSVTIHVSPDGGGDGTTADAPMSVADAMAAARPNTLIRFARGRYQGCFELTKETGGTYDEPVVLLADHNEDGTPGAAIECCPSKRQTCINLEGANYVAIDGFELVGGLYGVRAVGLGFPASEHSRGIAVLGCRGHDQSKDPFASAQSDWNVWEGIVASGAGEGDGHGLYISGGSDLNIVRFNETFANSSSDFQINADPKSNCEDAGIAYDDPRCDAYAGEGEGGQGASDYMLVEGNYFHHGKGPGANFTSVRRSLIRNNVFGPEARHNVSFWQETDNPKLGSSENKILHNIFVTTGRHGVNFSNGSTNNTFANNILIGIAAGEGAPRGNPEALLMEVDDTVAGNAYRGNVYVSGRLEGREAAGTETVIEDLSPAWFERWPARVEDRVEGFAPAAGAPFLDTVEAVPEAPIDRNGAPRSGKVDPGPIERP